jgi:hypothetical protein
MQCCASTAVATGTAKKMLWLAGLACALAWARAAAAVEMDRPQYICAHVHWPWELTAKARARDY